MQQETAILHMTDLHWGKKTASFGVEICKARLERLGRELANIRSLLSGYDFDRLVIAMGGDMNDGTGIYPTQEHHQETTNVEQQADEMTDFMAPWCRTQKQVWGGLDIITVPGNHGRVSKFAHEAASWDLVAYKYLRLKLQNDGIDVHINEKSDPFLNKFDVRGHKYLLYHGQDIKAFQNIPWYGMSARFSRWLSTSIAPFDVVMMGHYHSFGRWSINKFDLLMSGTMVSGDDWALRALGWESTCRWHLFGSSNRHPITWSYAMELAEEPETAVFAT